MNAQQATQLGSASRPGSGRGDRSSLCPAIPRSRRAHAVYLTGPHRRDRRRQRREAVNDFLDLTAVDRTEGGWVVIGAALGVQLERDLDGAFARCRDFIIAGDVWYAADILAERVPGPALVSRFQPALALLAPWREDPDAWVRRAVGVGVHFWAKRSRGAPEQAPQAGRLLVFLGPMFEEWDISAVKGVGWGLKTLGRYYPDLVADWLPAQVARPHRALMLNKALTYLSDQGRARATQ